MRDFSGFDIHIYKLPEKSHYFDYTIGSSFFNALKYNELIGDGEFDVHLKLTKTSTFIELEISFDGSVELVCDRSLLSFRENMQGKNILILKFAEEEKEISEDVILISPDTQTINVAQYIFEFIALQVPMKRLHPDYRQENFEYFSADKEEEKKENEIDPRWEKLKKLKQDKNGTS